MERLFKEIYELSVSQLLQFTLSSSFRILFENFLIEFDWALIFESIVCKFLSQSFDGTIYELFSWPFKSLSASLWVM